jgi:signal peptidase
MAKKVLKIVFDVIAWAVLILALLVTIIVFSADRNNGVATLLGYIPLTVESDSMKPTFEADDLILVKEIDDVAKLKEGDVITFWTLDIVDGQRVKNTHRITAVNEVDGSYSFTTKGDNNSLEDTSTVYTSDIIGKWTNVKISGMGKVMSFLRTKTGFFVCIIIPMAIFFLFELYKLIVTVVEIRRPEAELDEEEIKKKAIEEYLAEQEKKSQEKTEETAETSTEEDKQDKQQ